MADNKMFALHVYSLLTYLLYHACYIILIVEYMLLCDPVTLNKTCFYKGFNLKKIFQ